MEPDELAQLEIVVAAPHSVLRSTEAIRPRGWSRRSDRRASTSSAIRAAARYGSRPGVTADWDGSSRRRRRANVAIEIDGDPSRQDLDYELARRAVDAGCLFALDSDAHSTGELALRGNRDRARASRRRARRSRRQLLAD